MRTFKMAVVAVLLTTMAALTPSLSRAQIQLSFTGTPTLTGSAGTVGARYTYASVGTTGGITIKAVVEIIAIISAGLDNIDAPGSSGGSENAFQPVINGSQTANNCWGIHFRISFFNASTNAALTLSSFRASGIDIDGNGSSLREYNTFYDPYSYTLNTPTNLTVTNNSGVYQFLAPATSYAGISLTQTNVAVTCLYNNRSSIDLLIGSCCSGSSCSVAAGSGRQHSINFFDAISYTSPLVVLPVSLVSFSASRVQGGTLVRWSSADEVNLSNFAIQKSSGGTAFSDIATVPASGNHHDYSYTDQSPLVNNAYYRLKIVDMDGNTSFSQVVSVSGAAIERNSVSVSLDANQKPNLLLSIVRPQPARIDVFSGDGKLIKTLHQQLITGSQVMPLDLGPTTAGQMLIIRVTLASGWAQTIKTLLR